MAGLSWRVRCWRDEFVAGKEGIEGVKLKSGMTLVVRWSSSLRV